jgi:cytochrome c peroxidase
MLKGIPGYAKLFEAAYPNDKDPITMPNAVTAIAAFEATLITPNSPFDKFLRGDANALSAEQKEGLKLFYGLCRLSFGHQCWWSDVRSVWGRSETGR